MAAANANGDKKKFEEDIKPPFLTLYSFSCTQKIPETKILNKMKDPAGLYPDLPDKLDHYAEGQELKVINGFIARELVISGAGFQIGKTPKLDSECGLIVWYDNNSNEEKPVVAEFSFRYGDKDESYTRNIAYRAYQVFRILQENLTLWTDPESETKTAYVYS